MDDQLKTFEFDLQSENIDRQKKAGEVFQPPAQAQHQVNDIDAKCLHCVFTPRNPAP